MSKRNYEERTEELLLPILEENGFSLVDVEYVKEGSSWYLRAYIDKEGGIAVDDCELVSRALEARLDEEDLIKEPYILEVSSPGLGRPLKKEKDYVRNRGKDVEIRLYKAVEHEKVWTGCLDSWDEDSVTVLTGDGETRTFEKKQIALIREAFDW